HLTGEACDVRARLRTNTARMIGDRCYRNQFPPLIAQFSDLRSDGDRVGKRIIVLRPKRPIADGLHRSRYTDPFILPSLAHRMFLLMLAAIEQDADAIACLKQLDPLCTLRES